MRAAKLAPLVAAVVLGGAVGAVASSWALQRADHHGQNLHDVVHERFDLTPAEHDRLDAAERLYAARRAAIESRIREANRALAEAIRSTPELSPEVLRASGAVEAAAAELQRVTLQHIFEMRDALDPAHRAEYDRVLVTALTRGQQ